MAEAAPSLRSALAKFSKLLSAYERSEGRAGPVPTTLSRNAWKPSSNTLYTHGLIHAQTSASHSATVDMVGGSDEVTPEFLVVGVSTPLRAPRQELESQELTPFQESTPLWR